MALSQNTTNRKTRSYQLYENMKGLLASSQLKPGERLPSERDLEQQYGISRVTVSKAITRLRTEGLVCRKPGRKGNFVAETISTPTSLAGKLVRFVVPGPRDKSRELKERTSHGVLEGIHDQLNGNGSDVVISFIDDCTESACQQMIATSQESCLGFVVWYNPHFHTEIFLKSAQAAGIPLVVVDAYPPKHEVDYVVSDNIAGGHTVVDHLVQMGHRRLCYVRSELDRSSLRDRHTGFLRGAVDNHLDLSSIGTIEVKGDFESGAKSVVEDLLRGDWTAVAVSQGALAIELELALLRRGVRIPDEISITSYDDIDYASLLPVPLTTVKQDFYQMGKMATEILLDRQAGRSSQRVQQMSLPTKLIVRQSVKNISCNQSEKREEKAVV